MRPQHYVTFLRGINLGKRRVQMLRLAALFEAMRFQEVRTFIGSMRKLVARHFAELAASS